MKASKSHFALAGVGNMQATLQQRWCSCWSLVAYLPRLLSRSDNGISFDKDLIGGGCVGRRGPRMGPWVGRAQKLKTSLKLLFKIASFLAAVIFSEFGACGGGGPGRPRGRLSVPVGGALGWTKAFLH